MGHPAGSMHERSPNGTCSGEPSVTRALWDRRGARTMAASLLRDGDALLEEAMEVGLSGAGSFRPSGSFSNPFSREE